MHVKMRFYDKQMRELGVSYVVAPSEGYNFDSVKFYGEYVSPPGSYWMRMDLLTLQRPQQKITGGFMISSCVIWGNIASLIRLRCTKNWINLKPRMYMLECL